MSNEEKTSKGEKLTKQKVLKELFSTAIYLLVVLCATWLLITFVGQRTVVDGGSMETTFYDGDSLWVDKISYRFSEPKRFDVIVFNPFPNGTESGRKTYYIKRIIGLPGESVSIDMDGNIYIDGELLEESYGSERIDPSVRMFERALEEEIILGEDEYFVLGDHRNNSVDSRYIVVGNVNKKNMIGKAVFKLFPFNDFGPIKKK